MILFIEEANFHIIDKQLLINQPHHAMPMLKLKQKLCNPCHCFAVNDLVLVIDESVHQGK